MGSQTPWHTPRGRSKLTLLAREQAQKAHDEDFRKETRFNKNAATLRVSICSHPQNNWEQLENLPSPVSVLLSSHWLWNPRATTLTWGGVEKAS